MRAPSPKQQKATLLPDGLPSVEALEAHLDTLWNALPAAPTQADLAEFDRYHEALGHVGHWGAFMRFKRRVGRAMRAAFFLSLPALAGVLASA